MGHPSNTQKEKQELINSQLKQQSSMKRILVSDAIASLMVRLIVLFFYFTYLALCMFKDYVAKNEKEDHLLQGSMVKNKQGEKSEGHNPFRVRPSNNKCTIA